MKDLGLSAGKPVCFCISMSDTVNGELQRAEPSYLDTSSWRSQEGAWAEAVGQPAAEGLAEPLVPHPALLLPPPRPPPDLGSGG